MREAVRWGGGGVERKRRDEHVDAGVPAVGGGCERRCASELLKNIVVHVCVGFAMF